MIDIYSWATPNGHKMHIMLEECELPYRVHGINIGAGDQFEPDFLKISPNNKIPAIVDQDGPDGEPISLFESGVILLYPVGKTDKLLPDDMRSKYEVLQWLMFQMGGVDPMLGQVHHFRIYAPEKIEYAVNRYTNETKRLYGVIDRCLGELEFPNGPNRSIADTATWPWLRSWKNRGIELSGFPKPQRWSEAIEEWPAVQRAVKVLIRERPAVQDDKTREIPLGATRYTRR